MYVCIYIYTYIYIYLYGKIITISLFTLLQALFIASWYGDPDFARGWVDVEDEEGVDSESAKLIAVNESSLFVSFIRLLGLYSVIC